MDNFNDVGRKRFWEKRNIQSLHPKKTMFIKRSFEGLKKDPIL